MMNSREELWARVLSEVAGAATCPKIEIAIRWADEALKAFDNRFKNNKETVEEKKQFYKLTVKRSK